MTWLEVIHDHFPEPLEAKTNVTAPKQNCEVKSNFYLAIDLFIKKVLDIKSRGSYNTFTWHWEVTML